LILFLPFLRDDLEYIITVHYSSQIAIHSSQTEIASSQVTQKQPEVFRWISLLSEGDVNTFEVVYSPMFSHFCDDSYSKDKKNVFYLGKKIVGADGQTFEWVTDKNVKGESTRDKNYLYASGEIAQKRIQ
jgi:hypothetical protein